MPDRGGVFSLLSEPTRRLLKELKLSAPTPPQDLAIPAILARKDILLIAPTGSGKTEAALLPLLDRLVGGGEDGIRLLYITPLRAPHPGMQGRRRGVGGRR